VFLSNGSSKALQKNVSPKNRVEKLLQKNRPKKSKTDCSDLFYHVFGRFSVGGVQKHLAAEAARISFDFFVLQV
jgi:hypothetical protein